MERRLRQAPTLNLEGAEFEDLDFFFEDEADFVFVEGYIQRGALLEMFPHDFAGLGVDSADAQVGRSFETGGLGVGVVIVLFVAGIVRLNGKYVFSGNVTDESAGLSGPKSFAGLGID